MTELLPCSHCGGEAELLTFWDFYKFSCKNADCTAHVADAPYVQHAEGTWYGSIDEARAAWNTRAAYEMDGFFYLPKPKQQLFSYTTGFSFDDLSLKSTGTVDVYAMTSAVQKWQEEALNAQIIERICEVFKPERTCNPVERDGVMRCPDCDYPLGIMSVPAYCAGCGAKLVSE